MVNDDSIVTGKRQRFMNLVKSTKDTYLPTISQTFKKSTTTVWDHTKNVPPYHYREFPYDMKLTFYPSYTTNIINGFQTRVRVSLQSPGNITSRRNRLLVALSKQYLRPGFNAPTPTTLSFVNSDEFDSSALDLDNEDDTFSDSTVPVSRNNLDSSYTPTELDSNELNVLKERLTGFIRKAVGNVPLTVTLYNENQELTEQIKSDSKGYVDEEFETSFLPTKVKICLDHNQSLDFSMDMTEIKPTTYVKPEGIAIISDIDDTIKHTGITGDKRSMFRNVFVHDIESWSIKDIPEWYNHLKSLYDADFFYVSNSPMQLYPVLKEYITKYLPMGPMFLKQYSGNLLSGIMTSSANRKLNSITTIINDFPTKKFILIGDSGEQDLEAYVSTALKYPDQVVAIYIRCCKNSMSDMGLNEREIMNELNDLIYYQYVKPFQGYDDTGKDHSVSPALPPRPSIPKKKFSITNSQMNLIKLSKLNHHPSSDNKNDESCISGSDSSTPVSPQSGSPPPIISTRSTSSSPQELYIHNTDPSMKRRVPPPPLPHLLEKTHTDSELIDLLNKRNKLRLEPYGDIQNDTKSASMMPSSQNDHITYNNNNFDKRAESWNRRVKQSIGQLTEIGKYDLGLMFFSDPKEAEKDSIARISELKK
ncbi:phosphatidate phosphatase App1p [Monosporozyma unispora]